MPIRPSLIIPGGIVGSVTRAIGAANPLWQACFDAAPGRKLPPRVSQHPGQMILVRPGSRRPCRRRPALDAGVDAPVVVTYHAVFEDGKAAALTPSRLAPGRSGLSLARQEVTVPTECLCHATNGDKSPSPKPSSTETIINSVHLLHPRRVVEVGLHT